MRIDEYCQYDAVGLASLVKTGDIDPVDLTRTAVAAIESVNPKLNAVIEIYDDRIEGLKDTDLQDGPFLGVPFLLKDVGQTQKGRKSEQGSRLLEGYVADTDSEFTARVKQAGFNIIGRTSCPEMGSTFTTETDLYGDTRNPWNLDRITGGSSGGCAAIVAAGGVPISNANDGAGSTRVPASMCGNVGLKHSRGRVSQAPHGSALSFPLFDEGVNSRTVRDSAAFLDALQGSVSGEATCDNGTPITYQDVLVGNCPKSRIAASVEPWGLYNMDSEAASEVERVAELCIDLGHTIEFVVPPIDFEQFYSSFEVIWSVDSGVFMNLAAEEVGREISQATVQPITLKLYEASKAYSAVDRVQATLDMNHVSRQLGVFFETYDFLLTPTTARKTPGFGSDINLNSELPLADWYQGIFSRFPYTPLCNFTGVPGISLPLAKWDDGMPLGMHFVGAMGSEDRLLALAASLERASPWGGDRPNVFAGF